MKISKDTLLERAQGKAKITNHSVNSKDIHAKVGQQLCSLNVREERSVHGKASAVSYDNRSFFDNFPNSHEIKNNLGGGLICSHDLQELHYMSWTEMHRRNERIWLTLQQKR